MCCLPVRWKIDVIPESVKVQSQMISLILSGQIPSGVVKSALEVGTSLPSALMP